MWVKHLEQMAHLKEGIGLRRYQQEDPMRIYQREGLELFGKNYQELRRKIVEELYIYEKFDEQGGGITMGLFSFFKKTIKSVSIVLSTQKKS